MLERRGPKITKSPLASVTGTNITQVVVPAREGYVVGITQLFAANQGNSIVEVSIYEETTKLIPDIVLGASGTFVWDVPGGGELELTKGSGISASTNGNTVDIKAFYILRDQRNGLTKVAARSGTYAAPRVIRTPNFFGNQG